MSFAMDDAPHADLALAPADLEREYSPSSCIGGDYRPFIGAYGTRSRAARERAVAQGARWLELRYGAGAAQRIDLCLPPGDARAAAAPLLVFIHGGYWQELSAAQSLFAAARCAEAGAAFAAIDYTLAPAATVAGIVAECRAAMRTLFDAAPAHGLDAGRVVVAGSSAGAHLAAMVSLPGAANPRLPAAAVLVSGVYRLEPLVPTSINHALGLDAAAARAVSPRLAPLAGFPRAIVCWGEVETAAFGRQSRDFADALEAAGTPTTRFEIAAKNHFDVILDLAEPGTALGDATRALLLSRR